MESKLEGLMEQANLTETEAAVLRHLYRKLSGGDFSALGNIEGILILWVVTGRISFETDEKLDGLALDIAYPEAKEAAV